MNSNFAPSYLEYSNLIISLAITSSSKAKKGYSPTKAKLAIKKALSISSNYEDAYIIFSRINYHLNENSEAGGHNTKGIKLGSKNKWSAINSARILSQKNNCTSSNNILEVLLLSNDISRIQRVAAVRNFVTANYIKHGSLQEDADSYNLEMEIHSKNSRAHSGYIGFLVFKLSDLDKAIYEGKKKLENVSPYNTIQITNYIACAYYIKLVNVKNDKAKANEILANIKTLKVNTEKVIVMLNANLSTNLISKQIKQHLSASYL